jgi:hypothetical protein
MFHFLARSLRSLGPVFRFQRSRPAREASSCRFEPPVLASCSGTALLATAAMLPGSIIVFQRSIVVFRRSIAVLSVSSPRAARASPRACGASSRAPGAPDVGFEHPSNDFPRRGNDFEHPTRVPSIQLTVSSVLPSFLVHLFPFLTSDLPFLTTVFPFLTIDLPFLTTGVSILDDRPSILNHRCFILDDRPSILNHRVFHLGTHDLPFLTPGVPFSSTMVTIARFGTPFSSAPGQRESGRPVDGPRPSGSS